MLWCFSFQINTDWLGGAVTPSWLYSEETISSLELNVALSVL